LKAKPFLCRRQRQPAGHGQDLGRGADAKVFCFFSSLLSGSLTTLRQERFDI
jgi:hypothetical protein